MFIFKFVLVHKETIRLQIHKDLGNFWLAAYRLFFCFYFFSQCLFMVYVKCMSRNPNFNVSG